MLLLGHKKVVPEFLDRDYEKVRRTPLAAPLLDSSIDACLPPITP